MIITGAEYDRRLQALREEMGKAGADMYLIYGDEFRRENMRYMTNYWPIFERGLLLVTHDKDPILLVSPECEHVARHDSHWQDIRLIPDVGMAYVPDEVEFTNVQFTSLKAVAEEAAGTGRIKVLVSGLDAMCKQLYERIKSILGERATLIDGDPILYGMRRIKSSEEVAALQKAWAICDTGYRAVMEADIVGLTEIQAAAIAEKAARDAGAEDIVFSLLTAGEERTNMVVGRAGENSIGRGDMIMFALAVQYEGYVASDEWPFSAGYSPSEKQQEVCGHLIRAEHLGVQSIRPGVLQGDVVKVIRDYFRQNNLEAYDLYPPMHGNGLAEAESPYPDEKSKDPFVPGTGINFDVSLFGIPGVGSNRIEEGFIVTPDGLLSLSPYISSLREEFIRTHGT